MSNILAAINQQVNLVASLHDTLGRLVPIAEPHWSVDVPSVVVLSNHDGLYTTVYTIGPGLANITARLGLLSQVTTISVVQPTLSTIAVQASLPVDTIVPPELLH